MTKKRRWLWIVIPLAVLILIGAATAIAWHSPLFGKSLPEHASTFNPDALEKKPTTENPQEASGDQEGVADDENLGLDPNDEETEEQPVDQNKDPLCDGPERMSVLVLGIDEQAQSDAIRLVSIDFLSGEVNVLSIPRDFYVQIVGFKDHNITIGRINATYGYGEKFNGQGKGIFSLAENLTYNFGVEFDHYVVLYFDNIAGYIDDIGGVDVLLDKVVSDNTHYFSSGLHHFDGETAVTFMRIRLYDDDFRRVQRQTLILRAFYSKVMSELTPIQQTQLALKGITDKNIQTDFAAKDLTPLICLARKIDSDDVNFIEIPKDMYRSATTSSGGAVLIPNDSIVPFIQNVMRSD